MFVVYIVSPVPMTVIKTFIQILLLIIQYNYYTIISGELEVFTSEYVVNGKTGALYWILITLNECSLIMIL